VSVHQVENSSKKSNSLVIPIFRNHGSLSRLIQELEKVNVQLDSNLEVVFVIDGSDDDSAKYLLENLSSYRFACRVVSHSRNFGSFAAIRTGMAFTEGKFIATYSADLQEPPEIILQFFSKLNENNIDVVVATRNTREDRFFSRKLSNLYWKMYKKYVNSDIPRGGVDVFACNEKFKNELLKLQESRTSLVALIYWLGFNRAEISYNRLPRLEGKSAWTLRKKIDYMLDSIFSFTELPIKLLFRVGLIGLVISTLTSIIVIFARFAGGIEVPGYTPTVLLVVFFGALNIFGLGLVGNYAWRAYENTKFRPQSIIDFEINNFPEEHK
jgi:glycosyltransferase involved in cell wall biosynthesis